MTIVDDGGTVRDMLEAAREAQQFIVAVSLDQYLQNLMLQRAIERLVEIIGEAARKVSDTFKTAHADIPWPAIIAP
jgi:uncharacterized protein with HEPN domain